MNDINERVRREWTEATTGRERVREVLTETSAPTTAGDIADRALVSEPTARKYLEEFVETGLGEEKQDGRTTRYKRHEGHLVDRRIEELRTTHSRQELVDGIRSMKETLAGFRETYGLEDPEDLAIELEPDDEGWGDVGRWRATRRNLAMAQAALRVDEAHRLADV